MDGMLLQLMKMILVRELNDEEQIKFKFEQQEFEELKECAKKFL